MTARRQRRDAEHLALAGAEAEPLVRTRRTRRRGRPSMPGRERRARRRPSRERRAVAGRGRSRRCPAWGRPASCSARARTARRCGRRGRPPARARWRRTPDAPACGQPVHVLVRHGAVGRPEHAQVADRTWPGCGRRRRSTQRRRHDVAEPSPRCRSPARSCPRGVTRSSSPWFESIGYSTPCNAIMLYQVPSGSKSSSSGFATGWSPSGTRLRLAIIVQEPSCVNADHAVGNVRRPRASSPRRPAGAYRSVADEGHAGDAADQAAQRRRWSGSTAAPRRPSRRGRSGVTLEMRPPRTRLLELPV